VSDEVEHRTKKPEPPNAEDREGALMRGEYETNQRHRKEMEVLRRSQDEKLLQLLERTCNVLGGRFTDVEETVREMHGDLRTERVLFEEIKERQDGHEGRIRELEKSMASVKAWILIVGGITGIASFLAIVLK
jgi:hypothetical protein